VLQRILRGRLTFTPRLVAGRPEGYDFSGPTRFDRLFTGIIHEQPTWMQLQAGDEAGMEQIGPADTLDADYGRLLENAKKYWCARRGSNPRPTGSKPVALSS
jgi:hypothetical protein